MLCRGQDFFKATLTLIQASGPSITRPLESMALLCVHLGSRTAVACLFEVRLVLQTGIDCEMASRYVTDCSHPEGSIAITASFHSSSLCRGHALSHRIRSSRFIRASAVARRAKYTHGGNAARLGTACLIFVHTSLKGVDAHAVCASQASLSYIQMDK